MLTFHEALVECPNCDEKWYVAGTLQSWYSRFHGFAKNGGCSVVPRDTTTANKEWTIPSDKYYFCLNQFLQADQGRRFAQDILYQGELGKPSFKIVGYREKIQVKKIEAVAK